MSSHRPSFAAAAALLGLMAYSSPATAECGLTSAEYTYWPPSPFTVVPPGDARCNPDGYCHLEGVLYTPSGPSSGLPALIYVPGSGKQHDQSDACSMISYFVDRHYVVFYAYPRGVGNSSGTISNTGIYVEDWVDQNSDLCTLDTPQDCKAQLTVRYMRQEAADLREVVNFLSGLRNARGRKLIDSGKIAMAGHSFGGALVTLASSMWSGAAIRPAVTIDMSGGVLSWHGSFVWPDALDNAATAHQMPIFMFQTTNESPVYGSGPLDEAIQSTVQPFLHADGHGTGEAEMEVFSKVPDLDPVCVANQGVSECAHLQFIQDAVQVGRWAPHVRDFLRRHGVK